jgi:hypothetical protein
VARRPGVRAYQQVAITVLAVDQRGAPRLS